MKSKIVKSFLDKTNLPFSFIYGDSSSKEIIKDWKISNTRKEEQNRTLHTIIYTDPVTGLELTSEVIEYKDFPAIEWVHYFKNTSNKDTPVLKDVYACDVTFDIVDAKKGEVSEGEAILHRTLGCTSTAADFASVDEILCPGTDRKIASIRGRSSNGNLPFFNLEMQHLKMREKQGVIIAIGWTGQWVAHFKRGYSLDSKKFGEVIVQAGMEKAHLRLLPGEQIRTPRMLLFFWQANDRIYGHNQYRKFIVQYHTPHIDGKPVDLIMAGCTWFIHDRGNSCDEQNQLEYIDIYKKKGLDINCWWIDAGWFEGGWPDGVGNWFPKKHFPNQFKTISAAAHKAGMKFLLWFEPERVAETSQIYREHPEWTLAAPKGAQKRGEVFCPGPPGGGPINYLFDMGNSDARKWLTDHISKMIQDNNIDIYRHDANIDPMDFWSTNENPQRIGIREIRYVEGLYEFWEELKRRKPGLIVECCCSGNRRFDLETITRTVNLWRSDFAFRSVTDQSQTYGLSYYVVLHSNGLNKSDKYSFRSMLCPSMVINSDPGRPDFPQKQMQENIRLFYQVRPFFYGDYYPLTNYSTRETVWLAYQYHREDMGKGVVFAFRRSECEDNELDVKLGSVLPDKQYEVENVDTDEKKILTGAELAAGLKIMSYAKPEAVVLLYQQISEVENEK